jgi:AraC-like DNA-binding protein
MPDGAGLYERPATSHNETAPLWHLDEARTFFVGPLDYNAAHQHGAPVYIAGLYGTFGLRISGGPWRACRSAVIPAGVIHELDLGGNPLAVLYVEGWEGDAGSLAPLAGPSAREEDGVLMGSAGEISLVRSLFEDRTSVAWAGPALDDLLHFAKARARRPLEPRLARALKLMDRYGSDLVLATATQCAGAAGLSLSRFQYLFTARMGVPFRRYRAWTRMRRAIGEIVAGDNFTMAAHAAGFADQSHFAHDFRRTFGAPASRSLLGIRT